jgi:hypothetical protein
MQLVETGRGENMENEVENTVEETQEESNPVSQLREQLKKAQSENKELKAFKADAVFKEAGFDTSTGEGKALKNLYDGELQADAIKQFASQEFGWGQAPAEATEQEAQKQKVVTSQENLDTVIEASVPVEPVGLDDQINQAQADGDWATSSALKADKLKQLLKDK